MPEIVTIGLDIAKNVFQLHARGQEWKDRPAQGAAAQPGAGFLQQAAALPDRDGGLRDGSPLGAHAHGLRPRGPPDPSRLRQTLSAPTEE